MNEKNHRKYSDKFHLAVLDLTKVDMATKEDREYHLDLWARFFKCRDWSDVVMLAQQNEDIANAAGAVYQLTQEERIRQQCEAREDYYRLQRSQKKWIATLEREKEELEQETEELKQEKEELEQEKEELEQEKEELKQESKQFKQAAEELKRENEQLHLAMDEQAQLIEQLRNEVKNK